MRSQWVSFVCSVGTAFALLSTLTSAAVAGPPLRMGTAILDEANTPEHIASLSPRATTCTQLQVPNGVYWVDLADDGSISDTVTSYPSGVLTVTAAFDYSCIPNRTTLSLIWSIDGQTVATNKFGLKANPSPGTNVYGLYNTDGSAMRDGDYGIQFFVGLNLVASGDISVGNTASNTVLTSTELTDVQVQGTVVDAATKKPISGAVIIVLKPNVDITNWLLFGSDADRVAAAKSDSTGAFSLDNRVSVDVGYPWVIGAKGYRSIADPVFTITQQYATDPYVMSLTLDRTR